MKAATSKRGVRAGQKTLQMLVGRAQAGDRAAIEELYLLHFDRIFGYLVMTVGNRHDAEDLTIQTFLTMIESIDRFRWQAAPFSAWLFRIARNHAIDHFRARSRSQPEENVPELPGTEQPSAEEQALYELGRSNMLRLISSLPPVQRHVLILKFLFDFSNAEVAVVLDKSEGAVKALQHRALSSLQRQTALAA